jgi:hypothetical protein
MSQSTHDLIMSTLDIIKVLYQNQINDLSKKLQNINYINIDALVNKIEEELASDELEQNFDKVVSIIESIIQD